MRSVNAASSGRQTFDVSLEYPSLTIKRNRFCRASGTIIGPMLGYVPMWYYWPEAHGYLVSWPSALLWGPAVICDLIYPFVLRRVRSTEVTLPDGRLVADPARVKKRD